jgi:hypothetical protein
LVGSKQADAAAIIPGGVFLSLAEVSPGMEKAFCG